MRNEKLSLGMGKLGDGMRRITLPGALLAALFGLGLALAACGGSKSVRRPDDSRCTVVGGEVLYDVAADRLTSTVTVTVADDEGLGLEGQLVTLDASRPADDVEESEGLVTDANGLAVFHVSSGAFGTGEFLATLPERFLVLTELGIVEFTLAASATYGDPSFDDAGGTLDVDVVLSDAAGTVTGAEVALVSNRQTDAIAPASAVTGASGDAAFSLTAVLQGDVALSVEVGALEGSVPLDPLTIEGPAISGEVSYDQPFGVLTSPRVGLLTMDFEGWSDGTIGDPVELTSTGITVAQGGTVEYSLPLPLVVPPDHPIHPQDGGLPPDFKLATYLAVVYDDVGTTPGQMDAGDVLVAVDRMLPVVAWFQGALPTGWWDARLGYNLWENPMVSSDPAIVPWDTWADQMNLDITMAHTPAGEVAGTVHWGAGYPAGTETGMDLIMLDPAALQGGGNPFDPANYARVGTLALSYVAGTNEAYSFTLPDLTADPHYDSWAFNPGVGLELNWLALVLYPDANANGQWDPGSEPGYAPDQPFGVGQIWLWYLHPEMDWMVALMFGVAHAGWNAVRSPLDFQVQQVSTAQGRLGLDGTIEPGHTDIAFEVRREVSGDEQVILSGTDLDTGTVEGSDVWTAQDLTPVQVGDKLVITEVISDLEFLPLDTVIDYSAP